MNETDDFTRIQRQLSAVMTKSEWTSSKMRMQKTGDELRERRAEKQRKSNEFLQSLLEKRINSSLIDDHRIGDRYRNYLKYKSNLDNDDGSSIDDLERRLGELNRKPPMKIFKNDQSNCNTLLDTSFCLDPNDYSPEIFSNYEHSQDLSFRSSSSRRNLDEIQKQASNVVPTKIDNIRPSSTTNETIDEFLDQTFQDQDETDEKSHEEISGGSERTFNEAKKIVSVREDFQLVRPVALRPDGTKADSVPSSTREITKPWQSSAFPRSLTSRKTLPVNNSKRQLPSVPIVEPKITTPIEQFQSEQVFQLLDNLSSNDEEKSSKTFFSLLDQMKTIHVEPNCSSFSFTESNPVEQFSFNEKLRISAEKLFQHSICSGAERFYRTFVVSLNDSTNLPLYEMTVSTVQFSSTIQLPYSILDGRRPLIKYSNRTNFKPIQSKRNTWTCHVTALESPLETNSLKQNDIILQVNGESVLDLEIEQIIQLIKQFRRRSSELSLTVARLCQPSFHRDFV